jgi:hypothetical protein
MTPFNGLLKGISCGTTPPPPLRIDFNPEEEGPAGAGEVLGYEEGRRLDGGDAGGVIGTVVGFDRFLGEEGLDRL